MSYPHLITSEVITIIVNGQALSVTSGNPQFVYVRDAIRAGNWEEAVAAMDVKSSIKRWSENGFEITEEKVTYRGQELPDVLQKRIILFWQEGQPFQPLLNFFSRLEKNPSRNSVQQLYKFLEHGNMPIDDDGYFYGYKAVRLDWKDIHSGKFSNHIGAVLEVPRNQVDDDPARGCSYGFHVGSLQYAASFGGGPENSRKLIVKVDPANVVSVPHDCGYQKLRTSKYEVVSEYTGPLPETRWNGADVSYFEDEEEEVEYFDPNWDDEFDGWSDEDLEIEADILRAKLDQIGARLGEFV